jgi:hypothetical protein
LRLGNLLGYCMLAEAVGTGQVLSGIDVASPDPAPSTVAQVVTSAPRR